MALSNGDLMTAVSSADFKGLYQGGDGINASLAFAAEGENFDIFQGALTNKFAGENLPGELPAPIGTLAALYRRFYSGSGNETLLVAAAGPSIYAREVGSDTWQEIGTGFKRDDWDYVSYEVNTYYLDTVTGKRVTKEQYEAAPSGGIIKETATEAPIDVLLMSNAKDGMYCVYGDTLEMVKVTVQPKGAKEVRFGVIARHAERIWGGAIDGDPDKLMYSAPYDPFDWEQNDEIPEDGAGDIMQPSWDGDSFVALRPFGSQLLAFKRRKIWRIIGQDPSTYIFKEQYGGGTINENTVAVNNEYVLMLGYDGLYVYDGTVVSAFRHAYIKQFISGINWSAIRQAVAVMNGDVYMLAVPWGEDQLTNNRILEYNVVEKTFTVRTVSARTFLSSNNDLYYTTVETPGLVSVFSKTQTLPFRWVSAYQDLGAPNCTKSAFELYVTASKAVTITASVRTEKKIKTKVVSLAKNKTKLIRLNASGRRFRLEISSKTSDPVVFLGGLQLNMELDWD